MALIALFALKFVFAYFMPFVIALILSMIIEPLVLFLQKLKLKRGISVVLSILLFLGGFVAISAFAITRIVYELMKLYNRLQKYYDGIVVDLKYAFTKICDRLANIKYSKQKGSGMFNAYKKEHESFTKHLTCFRPVLLPMFEEMEMLFM